METINTAEANIKFAKLLSSAIYNNADVRSFLKNEALAQFDNDYDVFYPFVKNKIVSNGQTFREILLSYCETEKDLRQIEESSLLLNMLIPDLSAFGSPFSAESWDIEDKEVAVISRYDDALYVNGENVGTLPQEQIPGFPCVVVKANERLKVNKATTRASDAKYDFIADVYNAALNPKTRGWDIDIPLEAADEKGCYIRPNELDPRVIAAWNELGRSQYDLQRDHIYYGITPSNQMGALRKDIRESIHKFRIFPACYDKLTDNGWSGNTDPKLVDQLYRERSTMSPGEIIQKMWTDGRFEIHLDTYIGVDGNVLHHKIPYSLRASEIWSVDKVHEHHINGTWVRKEKNTYTFNVNDLKARWISGRGEAINDLFVQGWNLYSTSTIISMYISEYDYDATYETSRSVTSQYVSKIEGEANLETNLGKVGKLGVKVGGGYSSTTTTVTTEKTTTTYGCDQLGNISFNYSDPVIIGDKEKNTKGYNIFSVLSGNNFEIVMIPRAGYLP